MHRLSQIVAEFKGYLFFGLPGTQRRTDAPVERYTCGTHTIFPWGKGHDDPAAGVALAVRGKFFCDRNVSRVYTPPKQYQGRVGAVWFNGRMRKRKSSTTHSFGFVDSLSHNLRQFWRLRLVRQWLTSPTNDAVIARQSNLSVSTSLVDQLRSLLGTVMDMPARSCVGA